MTIKLKKLLASLFLITLLINSCGTSNNQEFADNFDHGNLNQAIWHITRKGDFRESIIDIFDIDSTNMTDYRLRLRADTIRTEAKTVKFHGVRGTKAINLDKGATISFSIDWNNQINGSYLTAGIYLCPTITSGNPKNESNWLKFEYIGVPPGHNARAVIATKVDGKMSQLYTEGWPWEQKTGRPIGNQQISIALGIGNIKVTENGRELYNSESQKLAFKKAYLYLQMSSHSNYSAREIYFDDITISGTSKN